MIKAYMVRNSAGKYWNGQPSWSRFDTTGKTWKKKNAAEGQIAFFFRYQKRYRHQTVVSIDDWEIVEVDVTPKVVATENASNLIRHIKIRQELENVSVNFSSFFSVMRDKGVEDDIEFVMELEPTPGQYWVDRERIKEARAQIRGMGIKTRTFREYRGMFGFLDRQQAMQARLVLNVKQAVDVGAIRKKVDAE